jgi:hypothetical protein
MNEKDLDVMSLSARPSPAKTAPPKGAALQGSGSAMQGQFGGRKTVREPSSTCFTDC